MGTYKYTQNVTIETCPRCDKAPHTFPIDILIDTVDFASMAAPSSINYDIYALCPETNKPIVISVPVSLNPGDKVVSIQARNLNE